MFCVTVFVHGLCYSFECYRMAHRVKGSILTTCDHWEMVRTLGDEPGRKMLGCDGKPFNLKLGCKPILFLCFLSSYYAMGKVCSHPVTFCLT